MAVTQAEFTLHGARDPTLSSFFVWCLAPFLALGMGDSATVPADTVGYKCLYRERPQLR